MNRKPFQNKFALFVVFLTVVILTHPAKCLHYSLNGLDLWYEKMVPALFPFMVLSGIIVRLNLSASFVKILQPVFAPLFRVRPACTYGILMGFLCGFPMGAQTATLLYEKKQISKSEATFLLAFCNNIGPVYFLSFALPALNLSSSFFFLFGMYGLPFLYGILLRYTVFHKALDAAIPNSLSLDDSSSPSILKALDESVWSALRGIARLGGYMIVFNLLFILPDFLFRFPWFSLSANPFPGSLPYMLDCLLEITGGIGLLGNKAPFFVLCLLPFGGFSCLAQTYSTLAATDLSMTEYSMHKMILCAITVFFYLSTWQLCS